MSNESYRESVPCPYCGEQNGDLWDHDFDGKECIEVGCDSCDGWFTLCQNIDVTYRVFKLKDEK